MVVINYPYWDWECYLNGMYEYQEPSDSKINLAKDLLENENLFFEEGLKMTEKWKISSIQHLTNRNINRLAWLGQATCCFSLGITERLTRLAWGKINEINKLKANKTANKIILIYENKNRELYRILENKGLL